MDLPVVNHKDYFAKIGDDHKFPINKFGDLADFLLKNKIVTKFHKPYPCSDETLKGAHSEKYINEIYEKEICLSPLKSLSLHMTNINSSYGLAPFIDYKKLWDENK